MPRLCHVIVYREWLQTAHSYVIFTDYSQAIELRRTFVGLRVYICVYLCVSVCVCLCSFEPSWNIWLFKRTESLSPFSMFKRQRISYTPVKPFPKKKNIIFFLSSSNPATKPVCFLPRDKIRVILTKPLFPLLSRVLALDESNAGLECQPLWGNKIRERWRYESVDPRCYSIQQVSQFSQRGASCHVLQLKLRCFQLFSRCCFIECVVCVTSIRDLIFLNFPRMSCARRDPPGKTETAS